MKLNEYMKAAQDGVLYHIGSKAGFLMVVTKEEYDRDLNHWEQEYFTRNKTSIIKGLSCIRSLALMRMSELSERIVLAKRKQLFQSMRKKIDILENWVPLGDRQIIDTYDRLTGGKCVIVKGNENGDFWYREEYEKWMATAGLKEAPNEEAD